MQRTPRRPAQFGAPSLAGRISRQMRLASEAQDAGNIPEMEEHNNFALGLGARGAGLGCAGIA
jgi:hypothetical protein